MNGAMRKPLALQKGDLRVTKIQQLKMEEDSIKTDTDEILDPPSWLYDKTAKAEWKRIIPQLLAINVVGNLDLANVAGYCNAYALYRKATKDLEGKPLVFSENGKAKENPFVNVQMKYANEMRRFADMCGLSISSRLKSAATETKRQEETIQQKFGAI